MAMTRTTRSMRAQAQRTTTSEPHGSEISDLWPVLTRFYGLSPLELAALPRTILRAYAREMGRIRSEEQLLALEASAYPHLKSSDARSVARRHERAARRGFSTPARVAGSDKELAGMAISAGIVVEFAEEAEREVQEEVV